MCNYLIMRKSPPLWKLGVDDWVYVDSFVIVIALNHYDITITKVSITW